MYILPVTDKQFYNKQKRADNISFKGVEQKACGYLNSSLKACTEDVISAYKDIYSRLFSQSSDIIKKVQGNFNDIDISDISKGINILNAEGNPNKIVNVSMPKNWGYSDYLQFQLKNSLTNEVEKTIIISDGYKVIKDSDSSFGNVSEDGNLEKEIKSFINVVDFPLLKLRKSVRDIAPVPSVYSPAQPVSLFIKKNTDNTVPSGYVQQAKKSHHKSKQPVSTAPKISTVKNAGRPKVNYAAIAGTFDESSKNLIASVTDRLSRVKQMFAGYSEAKGLRIKNAYPDIQLKGSKNGGFSFKNTSSNSEIITLHDIDNKKHGRLLRLMIENTENNSVKTYLISENRVVSNTNPKFPMFTPETLKYFSADEIKSVEPEITKYFNLYDEKLSDFEIFASQDLRVKKPAGRKAAAETKTVERKIKIKPEKVKLPAAVLPVDVSTDLKRASEIAEKSSEMLSQLSSSVAFKIKAGYQDVEVVHGLKMLIFKNTADKDIERAGILNLKRKNYNLVKILIQKKGEEPKYYLINNFSKIVTNCDASVNQVPFALKYADENYIKEADLNAFIKVLREKLEHYNAYVETETNARQMFSKPITKADFLELVNSLKFPKKRIYSEEYKNIVSECFEKFSKVVEDIQQQVKKFND